MALTKLDLDAAPWTAGKHPLERKKVPREGAPILIEFAPGFLDADVCTRGHSIYVISGLLGLELDGERHVVAAGQGCVVDAGTPHRAFNDGREPVVLFIVTDGAAGNGR